MSAIHITNAFTIFITRSAFGTNNILSEIIAIYNKNLPNQIQRGRKHRRKRGIGNCRRKRNNHARPLSLTWQTPCQIKRKYNNHWRMELATCTFLRFGAGSGRGSFEDKSWSSSCSDTSGQISSSVLSASDNSVLPSSDKLLFASLLQSPELASFSVTWGT